jgi:hypothetical protein
MNIKIKKVWRDLLLVIFTLILSGIIGNGKVYGQSISSFSWVGRNEDKVGINGQGTPNGRKDHCFHLVLNLPSPTEIISIELHSTTPDKKISEALVNSTTGPRWILGVFQNGKQLNQSYVKTLGNFSGKSDFYLYGDAESYLKKGTYFMVVIKFGNGKRLEKTALVGD